MKTKVRIDVDSGAAKYWIKTHGDTKIEDTPLWVLIGLGVGLREAILEAEAELDRLEDE